ncbi:helix-turn-helix domain-containing protein [Nocardiopsis rhodophaea]|uniref:helix-turn-helix domain-containing protein n=1 Tax=Nocardiopsis rhodophaea TaxID=280238 RepID=UPI0031CED3CF
MTTIGRTLAAARERVGYSIEELSARTCIRETVLAAMERDDFAPCGGDFYARGHIRSVCRAIAVDHTPLIEEYDREHASREEVGMVPAIPPNDDSAAEQRPVPSGASELFGRWAEAVRKARGRRELPDRARGEVPAEEDGPDNVRAVKPPPPPPSPPPPPREGPAPEGDRYAAARARIAAAFAAAANRYWSTLVTLTLAAAAVVAGIHAWTNSEAADGFVTASKPDVAQSRVDSAKRTEANREQGQATMVAETRERELPDEVEVTVSARARSWIRVVDGDGEHRFTGFLRSGEQREWTHPEELRLDLGNAGGVLLDVNGHQRGVPGAKGEVTRITVDREFASKSQERSEDDR